MKKHLLLALFAGLFGNIHSSEAGKKDKKPALKSPTPLTETFGIRNGKAVANKAEIIKELDTLKGTPVLEILLSEALLQKGGVLSGNPLGHLGMAVQGRVFSVSESYWKNTKKINVVLTLDDYLYGTRGEEIDHHAWASSIGSCYGRAVWGIRVYKLPARYDIQKILDYWTQANTGSLAGDVQYDYKATKQNCATQVARALIQGGFQNYVSGKHLIHYPRDIATDFLMEIADLPEGECEFEVVLYEQVPLSAKTRQYATSFSVPNMRWQRLLKSLPVVSKFNSTSTFKDNTHRTVTFEKSGDENPIAVVKEYRRESWLKKLKNRVTKEKWNQGERED